MKICRESFLTSLEPEFRLIQFSETILHVNDFIAKVFFYSMMIDFLKTSIHSRSQFLKSLIRIQLCALSRATSYFLPTIQEFFPSSDVSFKENLWKYVFLLTFFSYSIQSPRLQLNLILFSRFYSTKPPLFYSIFTFLGTKYSTQIYGFYKTQPISNEITMTRAIGW